MKAYVITIEGLPESENAAQRCVESGLKFGVSVDVFPATTPSDNPEMLMRARGFPLEGFKENPYSNYLPLLSCFLSHSTLWETAAQREDAILILEHDAVFVGEIPEIEEGVITLGKPSFGRFKTPREGRGPLVHKPYFGGAHGYVVGPESADKLLRSARKEAEPTDVFLRTSRFPWLEEYYPWPIECHDSVSTVQNERGCRAKHREVRPL